MPVHALEVERLACVVTKKVALSLLRAGKKLRVTVASKDLAGADLLDR